MCLYPRLIPNPKYVPNKKNGGHPPKLKDKRAAMVPIGCGECIECCKQKANEWKIRLTEELAGNPLNAYFVTLTFSNESLEKYLDDEGENDAAKKAVRHYLERWRKKYKKSLRHWFITELGQNETERLHLHGIVWCEERQKDDIAIIWKNGITYIGDFCNQKTINYIVKYVLKRDDKHKLWRPKVFCSAGIGEGYLKTKYKFNIYRKESTKEYYKQPNGLPINLPIYYRNHIYTDEQREKLWMQKLDKKEIFILGIKYSVKNSDDINIYIRALKEAKKQSVKLGYTSTLKDYDIDNYKKVINKMNITDKH